MRRLTYLVIFLGLLYSGYWFVGARSVETGAREGLTQLQADGWSVEYSNLATVGFPSRFDTTLTDVAITSPDRSMSWSGPFMQVFALSYKPNEVIAAFPETFDTTLAGQDYRVAAQGLRASGKVQASTDVALDAVTIETGQTTIETDAVGTLGVDRALLAFRQTPDGTNQYDLYVDADQIALPDTLLAQIDPNGQLAKQITRIDVTSTLGLDKPLDRHAFQDALTQPALEQLALTAANLAWGDIAVKASGALDIDASGVPEGTINFETGDWVEMIDLMVGFGVIDAGVAPTITRVANTMARGGDTLSLPVSFRNGMMSVGPLPLGPAPRFR